MGSNGRDSREHHTKEEVQLAFKHSHKILEYCVEELKLPLANVTLFQDGSGSLDSGLKMLSNDVGEKLMDLVYSRRFDIISSTLKIATCCGFVTRAKQIEKDGKVVL